MATTTRFIPDEPDEAAFPEPRGGGALVAIAGGVAASGSILLLLFAPVLTIVWLPLTAILTGAAVRRGVHFMTAAVAAAAFPVLVPFLATCLTGYWGFLAPFLLLLGIGLVLVVPVGFGIGRLLRGPVSRAYDVARAVLIVGALFSIVGWALAIRDALAPGSCPPAA